MAKILKTDEGKIVKVDMDKDICLYQSPVNPPNTGTDYTRGTNLYAHKTRKGNWYYYTHNWSMWEREEDFIELVSRKNAISILQHKATLSGYSELDKHETEKAIEHFGEDIFEETA